MRIDPARLFSPSPHLSPAKRNPDGHGLAEKGNHSVEPLPSVWHFEHEGWLVGGLGVWPTEFLLADALPLWAHRLHAWFPKCFAEASNGWPHEPQVYLHYQGQTVFFSGHLFLSVLNHMGRKKQSCPQRLIHLLLGGRPLASHTQPFVASRFLNLGRSRTPTDGHVYSILHACPGQSTRALIAHLDDAQLSWRGKDKDAVQGLAPLKGKLQLQGVPDVFENPSQQAIVQNWVMDGPNPHYRSQALGAHPFPLAGLVLRQWQPRKTQPYDLGEDPGVFDLAPINALIDQGQTWKPAMLQHVLSFLEPLRNAPDFLVLLEEIQRGFQRLSKTASKPSILTHPCFLTSGKHIRNPCSLPGFSSTPSYVQIIWLMGVLQVADLPTSEEQWKACTKLLYTLTQLPCGINPQGLASHQNRERIRHYRTQTKGLTRATQPHEWLVYTHEQGLLSQVRWDVYPWIATAFEHTGLPLAHWSPRLWLRAHHALHLAHQRATRRHIEALARQQESVAGLEHQAAWPACLPTRAALAGYRFHALLNPIVLTQEGDWMGHCVAGYVGACASGESRIYSMKDEAGEERVTLELVQGDHGLSPIVAQLQGASNSSPTEKAIQAARAFVDSLVSWPDHRAWPSVELAPCWQRFLNSRQSVEDEPFFEDVRNWVARNAPRLPYPTPSAQ